VVCLLDASRCKRRFVIANSMAVGLRCGHELAHPVQLMPPVCTGSTLPTFSSSIKLNEVEIYFPCVYCHDII
jgi:hypothetical protein